MGWDKDTSGGRGGVEGGGGGGGKTTCCWCSFVAEGEKKANAHNGATRVWCKKKKKKKKKLKRRVCPSRIRESWGEG